MAPGTAGRLFRNALTASTALATLISCSGPSPTARQAAPTPPPAFDEKQLAAAKIDVKELGELRGGIMVSTGMGNLDLLIGMQLDTGAGADHVVTNLNLSNNGQFIPVSSQVVVLPPTPPNVTSPTAPLVVATAAPNLIPPTPPVVTTPTAPSPTNPAPPTLANPAASNVLAALTLSPGGVSVSVPSGSAGTAPTAPSPRPDAANLATSAASNALGLTSASAASASTASAAATARLASAAPPAAGGTAPNTQPQFTVTGLGTANFKATLGDPNTTQIVQQLTGANITTMVSNRVNGIDVNQTATLNITASNLAQLSNRFLAQAFLNRFAAQTFPRR